MIFLRENNIKYEKDVDLSNYSHFKTGNRLEYLIQPINISEMKLVVNFLRSLSKEVKIIGKTSNILFHDKIVYDTFISTEFLNNIEYDFDNMLVKVESGVYLPDLVNSLAGNSIYGFEGLEGIPGTVGGALYMNASAYNYQISDYLDSVSILNSKGEVEVLYNDQLKFNYRHSIFKQKTNVVILSSTFTINNGDAKEITEKIDLYHLKRHTYQDFAFPTLGSLFATLDIYSEFAKFHWKYRILLALFRRFFHSKKCSRRPKNHKLVNALTEWYFKWDFEIQPYSDKTMNCLTNKDVDMEIYLDYIKKIQEVTFGNLQLENELLFDIEK